MKKFIIISVFLCLRVISASAQQNTSNDVSKDTANYPYWVQMMQDPNVNFFKVQRAFNIYWQNRPITKGCGWKVFKRWEYMMQSRVLPNGDRPAPELAEKSYEDFLKSYTSTNGNWISLGPATIPLPGPAGYEGLGRVNTVGYHPTDPNKFYIGSPSGGMWQTSDGGLTWVTHTDTMPTLGVSAIIVDYSNPNRIFIGTGDRDAGDATGLGVYKSINGGLSWSASKTGMGDKTVGSMIQDPTNSSIMLAATSGGVYRTVDAGNTWTLTESGNFKSIEFKPGNHSIIYAAGGSQFFRSSDNGVTFNLITSGVGSGQRSTIAVSAANPAYVYILYAAGDNGYGGVYRSTDSGLSFSMRSTSPNIMDWSCDGSGTGGQGWYDLALAADPTSANTIYVGGVNVWKSTDGGLTWTINSHWYGGCSVPSVHADCHYLGYSPVNGHLFAGNDGGVFSTSDGGTTWDYRITGVTIGQIYKLGQAQLSKNHVINGFQDNGTYTLTPADWVATGGGDGMECAIDFQNDGYSYYTLYYGDIYRRYNNAAERHIAGNGINGINESGGWVTPFIFNATDANTMFIGYKNIWRSTYIRVGNPTWQKISDNLGGSNGSDLVALENSPANTNILYASRSDTRFFRSDNCMDVNPTWVDLTPYLPVASTPTDITAHPTDPNTVYITAGNSVYKSVNKGVSWTNISLNLPAVHMNSIAYYKNDLEGLYVSTDAGVYYKNSSMTGWVPFSEGLPANAKVTEVEIYYDNDSVSSDVIRGCTYGRGLWGSDMYHAAPIADFTASKTTMPAGCSVNFTDLSSGTPTSWQWTFTGGTPSTSAVKNPSGIVYNTPGTYSVKMKIWNGNGSDSITKTNYITVNPAQAPAVSFTSDKTVLCEGDLVHFLDESDNCPVSWSWEFSPATLTFVQGTDASSQNPVVQFNVPGYYTVRLTASNATGSNSQTKLDYIIYGGYMLPFAEGFENGFNNQHWTVINSDNDKTWDTITIAGTSPGHLAAWINLFSYTKPNRDQLVSPPLNFSSYSSLALTFEHAYAQQATVKDSLIVKISGDCGTTWTRILAAGPDGTPNVFATHEKMSTSFFPQSAYDWCGSAYGTSCYQVDISPWAGMKNVKILFESYNRRGNNIFLDNISISGPTGVSDKESKYEEIRIYPNPTTGFVNIFFANPSSSVDLSVVNLQGQTLFSDHFSAKTGNLEKKLNLSGLAKGVYFFRIMSDQSTTVKKVILD
ncbi:MAG: PKD domain-containing protein [Bacteroidetes bacterium]|nr:PKD domain-containing protein [Bacteroidota bacterium]